MSKIRITVPREIDVGSDLDLPINPTEIISPTIHPVEQRPDPDNFSLTTFTRG